VLPSVNKMRKVSLVAIHPAADCARKGVSAVTLWGCSLNCLFLIFSSCNYLKYQARPKIGLCINSIQKKIIVDQYLQNITLQIRLPLTVSDSIRHDTIVDTCRIATSLSGGPFCLCEQEN